MHEDTPGRVAAIVAAHQTLASMVQAAMIDSTTFVAAAGAAASQLRAMYQMGVLTEGDPTMRNGFSNGQRTADRLEKMARDFAQMNMQLMHLIEQEGRDVAALQTRLAELEE